MRTCPNCSTELEERKCKLFCPRPGCGYFLSCAEVFDGRYSCMVSASTNLLGPYSARYEAIPHGGHNVFFKDDRNQWWSTYFGSDGTARFSVGSIDFRQQRRKNRRSRRHLDDLDARAVGHGEAGEPLADVERDLVAFARAFALRQQVELQIALV